MEFFNLRDDRLDGAIDMYLEGKSKPPTIGVVRI